MSTQIFLWSPYCPLWQRESGAGEMVYQRPATLKAKVLWEFGTYWIHIFPLLAWFLTPWSWLKGQKVTNCEMEAQNKCYSLFNSPVEFFQPFLSGWHRRNHVNPTSLSEGGRGPLLQVPVNSEDNGGPAFPPPGSVPSTSPCFCIPKHSNWFSP